LYKIIFGEIMKEKSFVKK